MANGATPDVILLEDLNDLADFAEAGRRTIPRHKWVDELVESAKTASLEALI